MERERMSESRLPRTAGLQDRRHHVPPARLLGPHRSRAPVGVRRERQRHPTPLLVPRPRRAEGHQEPARRRHLVAGRAQGDRVPARAARRRSRVGAPRARRPNVVLVQTGDRSSTCCATARACSTSCRSVRSSRPRSPSCGAVGPRAVTDRRAARAAREVGERAIDSEVLPHEQVRFAHNSERQFAKLLDFYASSGTTSRARSRSRPIATAGRRRRSRPTSTSRRTTSTSRSPRSTRSWSPRRTARRAGCVELHPDVSIRVLYQRDYLHLLVKYGLEPPSQLAEAGGPARVAPPRPPARSPFGAAPRRARRARPRPRAHEPDERSAQPARRAAPRARRAHGAVRRLGHAACSTRRARGAPRVPRARGGVRRVAPRHGRVRGPGAFDALQWLLTNDLDRIEPGRAQYTHLLDPDDAHVVDDIIVWWVDPTASS
jgi:hypothetical protein